MAVYKTVQLNDICDAVGLVGIVTKLAEEAQADTIYPDCILIPDVWLYINGSRDLYTFHAFPASRHLYAVLRSDPTTIYRVD
jgi:hypothetical protein